MPKTIYYRNLPHFQPLGGQFFITFRLKDSIPEAILKAYFQNRQTQFEQLKDNPAELYKASKRAFAQFDAYLDRCLTNHDYLKQNDVSQILIATMKAHDQKSYDLLAYCIMPNHVHVVLDLSCQELLANTSCYRDLYQITGSIKSYSAKRINTVLNRTGNLWQRESYDHFVRSPQELIRIIRYTILNPVNAGLTQEWTQWPYSYVAPHLLPEFL